MSVNILRGTSDKVLDQLVDALQKYQEDHPLAQIDLYRQNPVSVRIRIIDPGFSGEGKAQRSKHAWHYLDHLPDDVQGDISALLLLTPDETKKSFANLEFEDPVPSKL